ncbi:hypothetical protein SDC9_118219 [bioreactor metagenome]|uniref:Uncharacterized protein n=1 Tax=bioreactor metagenome TaxID=1076179 RepID=A0A645C0A9_9ZZZZ
MKLNEIIDGNVRIVGCSRPAHLLNFLRLIRVVLGP